MSKLLKMTPDVIAEARQAFENQVSSATMKDGFFELKFSLVRDRKATLVYEPKAWQKLILLLDSFSSEVAWHGIVTREQGEERDIYTVHDLLVYPQKVTGTNVDTDQKELEDWLFALDPEVRRNLRLHGHSHVNMQPTPSSTDAEHRKEILDQVIGDGFYIFQIWNKSFTYTVRIYDLARNLLYEGSDVDVVLRDGASPTAFLADARAKVRTNTYTSTATTYPKYNSPAAQTPAKQEKPKTKQMIPASEFYTHRDANVKPVDKSAVEDKDDEDLGAYTGKGYTGEMSRQLSSGWPYYDDRGDYDDLDVWAYANR